ncbi:hypothetical protein IY230_04070, partial [Acholeplasma laidlawii]|uniref:immunoglobulin-like domain-containing protein n=1 Tax=Acholeplasma laidlawii TaxID=2148 RepID=UPI0018C311A4
PATDANGVQISWAFKNADDPNNALLNLTNGAVTMPDEGLATVTVIATFQSGSVTDTKEISMVVGLPAVSTIAQALAKTSGYVRIHATVLGYSANDTIVVFDETGFIATFHNAKDVDLIALVGKEVEILGQRG